MIRIALSQGKYALIDDEDFERVNELNWHLASDKKKNYARTNIWVNGKRTSRNLHNFIMNTPHGFVTDHINGDGLDNRRKNLRVCTTSENLMNRGRQPNSTAPYKGITYYKRIKKWGAVIILKKKRFFLGVFEDPINAAKAYDQAAVKYHGEFARINFPKK